MEENPWEVEVASSHQVVEVEGVPLGGPQLDDLGENLPSLEEREGGERGLKDCYVTGVEHQAVHHDTARLEVVVVESLLALEVAEESQYHNCTSQYFGPNTHRRAHNPFHQSKYCHSTLLKILKHHFWGQQTPAPFLGVPIRLYEF